MQVRNSYDQICPFCVSFRLSENTLNPSLMKPIILQPLCSIEYHYACVHTDSARKIRSPGTGAGVQIILARFKLCQLVLGAHMVASIRFCLCDCLSRGCASRNRSSLRLISLGTRRLHHLLPVHVEIQLEHCFAFALPFRASTVQHYFGVVHFLGVPISASLSRPQ